MMRSLLTWNCHAHYASRAPFPGDMSEGKRIAELFRSVYEGDEKGEAWHGAALKPLLKGITAEQACRNPETGRHSILQLVWHIAYWNEVDLRRFNGEIVHAPLNSPDDWLLNRKVSEREWQAAALKRLENSYVAFHRAIEESSDDKLAKRVPGKDYDNYVLLHGIIHHCVYHTAQIALLKKSTF